MFHHKYKIKLLLIALTILFSSCTTYRANMHLLKQSPKVKADFLFEEAVYLYDTEFLVNRDFKSAKRVRQYFSDVVQLDPKNTISQEYVDDLDLFTSELFDSNMEIARLLSGLEGRSSDEDFQLVLAVMTLSESGRKDEELKILKKYIKELKPVVILGHAEQITDLEPQVYSEEEYEPLIEILIKLKKYLRELNQIDPKNKVYLSTNENVESFIESLTFDDIVDAEDKIFNKLYIEAELVVRRLERRHQVVFGISSDLILNTKYDLFYEWSLELYSKKNYKTAKNILALAIDIEASPEAGELSNKIESKLVVKVVKKTITPKKIDYDSQIDEIILGIDQSISKNNFKSAQNSINQNLSRLKIQKNKNSLLQRTNTIKRKVKIMYQDAISFYNEEDYASALENLKIITEYDIRYEQAKAYYDRVKTKLNALSGSN
ncbi:MAG: hypothetical protein OCD02_06135 [Spirochaetaceae bacterium]